MTDPQHGSGRREPFWQTMAGMLTAVAALITAIVGAAAFIYQIGGFGADGGQQAATGVTATPSVAISSAGTTGAQATPSRAGPVERAGAGPYELLFTNNGVDLDADPPKVATIPAHRSGSTACHCSLAFRRATRDLSREAATASARRAISTSQSSSSSSP
ncbi:hypothetical protein AB0C15_19120 [Micromonospora sp. NPDC048835]|uniref:hypothetical protein n=1 Tax=Micromonospora sp. NPDC048835 TaxID=3155147 RepID=UPI0033F9052E